MADVRPPREPAETSIRVEDLMFLDDLRALGIAWIDRLADACSTRDDVERVWTLVRMWGPDSEDAKDVLRLSGQVPHLEQEFGEVLGLIRLCENYPAQASLSEISPKH
jgi:hypothetical protein